MKNTIWNNLTEEEKVIRRLSLKRNSSKVLLFDEFLKQQKLKDKGMGDINRINEIIKEFGTIENYIKATDNQSIKKKKYYKKNIDKSLPAKYRQYLSRALDKELQFDLTVEQFESLCNNNCVYCNDTPCGVDRKDSSIGYTINNSQSCCTKCNMMKYTHSTDNFLLHIKKIYEFQKLSIS